MTRFAEPERCALCGNTDKRELRWGLVHWREAEPGMAYGTHRPVPGRRRLSLEGRRYRRYLAACRERERSMTANDDIAFLRSLADRISTALYYGNTTDPIGGGTVSTGIRHDDYDRLRGLAKRMEIESLEAQLEAAK